MTSKSAKRNVNRRRKGVAAFMLLFLVVGIVAAIIVFGNYISFAFKIANIKGKVNIFMVNDDAGTELVSLLNAKTGDVKHIELLGRYLSEDSDVNPIKKTLDSAYKYYDFSFNGIGSVDFKKGVPPVIQDETRTAIIGCGSSPVAGDIIQLSWPLSPDLKTVTSGFGPRDLGNKGVCSCHAGIDITSPVGNNVYAVALGIVSTVGEDDTSGKYVRVEHEFGPYKNKYYSYYMHLDKVSVVKGQEVDSNIVIGLSGNTGKSTGPHLHLEFRKSSEAPTQKGEYSINACNLFFDKNGNKMTIDKCEQEKVSACSYVSGMISGRSVRSYDTDIPLPGPSQKNGNLKGTVVFKQWD